MVINQNVCPASRQRFTSYGQGKIGPAYTVACPGCGGAVRLALVGNGMHDMIPTHKRVGSEINQG